MHPLLSREEIDALLDASGKAPREAPCPLTIELGPQRLELKGLFNLEQGAVIELNQSLGRSYEVRAKDKLVAYGELLVLDGKLVLQITRLMDCSVGGIME